MNTYRIVLKTALDVDAYTWDDAKDLAIDTMYEMDGLGVEVVDVVVREE
jgi:hypothetical protein